jgi:catechol 2,3-dioxygenase-like lactoylglutathione lyase family enzyme
MLRDAPVVPTIPVADLDRALAFYVGVLGLEVVESSPAGVFLAGGGGTMLFVYPRPGAPPADRTVAEFQVHGIDDLVRSLEARAVVFEDYDLPGLRTDGHIARLGPYRAAWFRDPDGNILAINER